MSWQKACLSWLERAVGLDALARNDRLAGRSCWQGAAGGPDCLEKSYHFRLKKALELQCLRFLGRTAGLCCWFRSCARGLQTPSWSALFGFSPSLHSAQTCHHSDTKCFHQNFLSAHFQNNSEWKLPLWLPHLNFQYVKGCLQRVN